VLGLSTFSLHRTESGRTVLPKGISKTINFSKYLYYNYPVTVCVTAVVSVRETNAGTVVPPISVSESVPLFKPRLPVAAPTDNTSSSATVILVAVKRFLFADEPTAV
jgi:hypothetical protein